MISKFVVAGLAVSFSAAAALVATAGAPAVATPVANPAAAAPAKAPSYTVDPVHSYVIFKIKHDGIGNNYGRFNGPTGTFTWDEASPESGTLEVSVKTDQVDTGMGKRDDHLKSGDFFDAKQFPTISFKSKSFKKGAAGKVDITGDLTLLGKTKTITVTAEPTGKTAKGAGIETTFTIKRSEYGMSKMIDRLSDEVTITVALEGGVK